MAGRLLNAAALNIVSETLLPVRAETDSTACSICVHFLLSIGTSSVVFCIICIKVYHAGMEASADLFALSCSWKLAAFSSSWLLVLWSFIATTLGLVLENILIAHALDVVSVTFFTTNRTSSLTRVVPIVFWQQYCDAQVNDSHLSTGNPK